MPKPSSRVLRLGLVLIWLAIVVLLMNRHVMWRDEVRGIIFAERGDTILGMWRGLRGDAHPALWHLLLRAAYGVFASPLVLPGVALAIAIAAAVLLALCAPFGLSLIALILAGDFFLYEYAVMARNYGISMVILFGLALAYPRWRTRGWPLGLLLFLLCNTNVHSVMLAGAFLLFWGLELLAARGLRWTPALRGWLIAALMTLAGALLCAVTIYPTVNDAAVTAHPGGIHFGEIARAILIPARSFTDLLIYRPFFAFDPGAHPTLIYNGKLTVALSALMLLAALQFVRAPAALAAALVSLLLFSLLFTIVYPGSYRHEALWLVFLIALRWLMGARGALSGGSGLPLRIQQTGTAAFVALLGLQALAGVSHVATLLRPSPPESQAYALAQAIRANPQLRDAVIIADPDWFTETLHYYLPNRSWFVREQRYGDIAIFTRHARQNIALADMHLAALRLNAETRRPVVILLSMKLDAAAPAQTLTEGYANTFRTTAAQTRAFLAATCELGHFRPAVSDEAYDAYVLGGPCKPR
jgi:hypothetical protein